MTTTAIAPAAERRAPDRPLPPGIFVVVGAVGAVGMALISISGGMLGAPGPTGFSIVHVANDLSPGGKAPGVIGLVLGLAAVMGAWLALGLLARRGATLRPLSAIAAAWSLPLLMGPPVFSRDVYSYAADGLMVSRHLEPNRYGPAALGGTHFLDSVSSVWLYTKSPYGPLFLRIAGWIVPLSRYNLLSTVMMLRLVAVLGVVLIAVALPKLAAATGHDPVRAFWLGVCNPLVLIHFVAGGHNDALMVGLIVSGLALAARKHPVAGMLVCVVGATVKAPAAIAVAFIIAEAVRALPRERRLGALFRYGTLSLGAFAALSWATGLGWHWLGAMGVPGVNRSLLTPSTFVAHFISDVVGHDAAVLSWSRNVFMLLTAASVGYLLWRAPRIGTTRACALALAATVVLGPIVLPWYVLWAIVLIAVDASALQRTYAVLTSLVLLIVLEPSGSTMPDAMLIITVVVMSAVAFVFVCAPVRDWFEAKLRIPDLF